MTTIYFCTFEDKLIMRGEDIVEVEYCMSKLVDMVLEHRMEPPSSDIKANLWDSLNVDERPPLIVKLVYAQCHVE